MSVGGYQTPVRAPAAKTNGVQMRPPRRWPARPSGPSDDRPAARRGPTARVPQIDRLNSRTDATCRRLFADCMSTRRHTARPPTHMASPERIRSAARPSSGSTSSSTTTALANYLKSASRARVMTAEQEAELAYEIMARRAMYWEAVISHDEFVEPILRFVFARFAEQETEFPEGSAVIDAWHAFTASERNDEAREALSAAVRAACTRLADLDRDAELSDLVVADLQARIQGAVNGLVLQAPFPAANDIGFANYLGRIKACGQRLRSARHQFITANLRLVISVARRLDCGLMPLQDLIQEGNIGLMKAVDRFDASRGFRFSTYASWWIRHGINRALANKARTVRLPAHVTADQLRISRAIQDFEGTHGEKPSAKALAEKTGLPLVRVRKLERVAFEPVASLDAANSNDDNRTLNDVLVDHAANMPNEELESQAVNGHLHDALRRLHPIEADILAKRFGLEDEDQQLTLRELGEHHRLSRERIRQLQERALDKLRGSFEDYGLMG
ncbi:MAG: sigma-70 family RNA polymerase sigma factor [Myxococcales bacterium FL481]|nr:MAG: sigma-70 family RNA polymerase sigma factor [Myxococcales bacterium FL481]